MYNSSIPLIVDSKQLERRQGATRHPADLHGLAERLAVVGVEVGRRRA